MAQDLRTYLDTLVNKHPEQLKLVDAEGDPVFEATAIVHKIQSDTRYPGFPAVLFRNIKGSTVPCLLNLHGTYDRLALSIGTDVHGMVAEYSKREGNTIPTTRVPSEKAPVQEVVLTGYDIDLTKFLLLVHQELDAGRYITSAATICRDPESGRLNAGIFRHQLQGPREVGFMTNPAHHTSYVLRALREMKKPMEVALVLGHHPAMLMGAVSKLAGIGGELEVMGGLLGESLEVTKAKTVDLDVPARAITLPLSGMARSHLYISMKKRVDGEPKIAACAAFAVDPLLKHVFVVDDDVDVFNEVDVLWMLATRFQADRDLVVMPNFLGGHLNPSTYGFHREEKGPMETKMIFDCTKPAPPASFPPICRVPPDVVKRVQPDKVLKDYTPGTRLSNDGVPGTRVREAATTG